MEVKTTLRLRDIAHFEKKLAVFKRWSPRYDNTVVYGAVAYMRADEGTAGFAQKKGLFVIRATGDSAHIINAPNFKPKVW